MQEQLEARIKELELINSKLEEENNNLIGAVYEAPEVCAGIIWNILDQLDPENCADCTAKERVLLDVYNELVECYPFLEDENADQDFEGTNYKAGNA